MQNIKIKMRSSWFAALPAMATTLAQAWKRKCQLFDSPPRPLTYRLKIVKWYSGINGNCTVIANSNFFVVRVWEGCGDSAHCVSAVLDPDTAASRHRHALSCRDYVYDGGELSFTEDCAREIGRGSAVVESGSCEFYSGGDCEGEPYLGLGEGVCGQEIYISNFTCVSLGSSSISFSELYVTSRRLLTVCDADR